MLHAWQGKWEKAEELRIQVVEGRVSLLGEGHPETIQVMESLENTLRSQGKWQDKKQKPGN
ncbi:hypothetical protein M378DRAFT_79479 [Amanita muscaria Koide BX008]|uniref:Kinesin light chain n=1 Tax=Amanita muscaria (strain Koide BX008) TaxID=946122 RepID=A0A0C2WPS1_AMAMK|nr:hypothetical protein M378DRAFT_79479 [Amanita muscaria Koide BX008]